MDLALKEGKSVEELTKKESEETKEEKDSSEEKKPVPVVIPTNSEGNEIDVDSNWKKFLNKQPKRENKAKKVIPKKKETIPKTKKKESFLEEENEIRGVKKVPLKKVPLKKASQT